MKPILIMLLAVPLLACGGGGGAPADDDGNDGNSGGGSGRDYGTPNDNQIRPGVLISSSDGSCTSNFIFSDSSGDLYIGAAAHCFSPDTNSGEDSCLVNNAAYGSAISIENASRSGSLAYSSWVEMKENGETPGSNACVHNDFALIKIHRDDYSNVHPSAIAWGGPTALLRGNANAGDHAYSYGQSSSHNGIRSQEEKDGPVRSQSGGGWKYDIDFDNPALPGDSGSAVLHESGKAFAVLSVVQASIGIGAPVNNGVVNLEMALDYANDSLGQGFKLETWSDFNP